MNTKEISDYVNIEESIIIDIKHYYDEPHRSYHSWNHITQGIKDFKYIEKEKIFIIEQSMKIAWLFHDIVYLPFNINSDLSNEELSLRTLEFYNSTKMFLPLDLIEESKKLIKATEKHISFDEKSAIFLDVDMAYLGADYDIFLNVRKKVREEYSNYSDNDFAKGTINFYLSMLRKDKIYQSDYGLLRYEQNARYNMDNDIKNQEKLLTLKNIKNKI